MRRPANTADRRAQLRAAWVRLRQGVSNRAVRLSLRALPHTLPVGLRFRGAAWSCGSVGAQCAGKGQKCRKAKRNAEERGDGAAACVRWRSCMCAVAVTCSASDALSLAEPASRLASLAAARELLMPLSLLQMVALRASSSASTAVTRTCHPRGLANRGLGKPSVAFWCRSESRNPPKPGADGRSMFACTASVVGPPASQRTPSSPQTDSRCSKSSPAERTGKP